MLNLKYELWNFEQYIAQRNRTHCGISVVFDIFLIYLEFQTMYESLIDLLLFLIVPIKKYTNIWLNMFWLLISVSRRWNCFNYSGTQCSKIHNNSGHKCFESFTVFYGVFTLSVSGTGTRKMGCMIYCRFLGDWGPHCFLLCSSRFRWWFRSRSKPVWLNHIILDSLSSECREDVCFCFCFCFKCLRAHLAQIKNLYKLNSTKIYLKKSLRDPSCQHIF